MSELFTGATSSVLIVKSLASQTSLYRVTLTLFTARHYPAISAVTSPRRATSCPDT